MLITQPADELFDDPTLRELLKGISSGFGDHTDALILLLAGSELERRRAASFLDQRRLDGVVHLTPHLEEPLLEQLVQRELPVVACGRLPADIAGPRIRTVAVDDYAGAAAAASLLKARGANRPALITGPADAPGSQERLRGVRDALCELFRPELVRYGDYTAPSGQRLAAELLDADPAIDAIFCASDRMAYGAWLELQRRGRRIPDEVQLTGFDGHSIGTEMRPTLTTVAQPIQRVGHEAITMLRELIDGRDPGHRFFPTELIIRGSTRPAAPTEGNQ
ncbi:LacI family DNA-binding transcriptional regulator [Tessaracoccus sp. OH4464_COT-324]|uniref:LacI family DNA-binding transcriptional regulator n=1 Tax=Tessaracoccus sp. OH4464_COT-324 TaxID=2491059 RepID=UPI0035136E73